MNRQSSGAALGPEDPAGTRQGLDGRDWTGGREAGKRLKLGSKFEDKTWAGSGAKGKERGRVTSEGKVLNSLMQGHSWGKGTYLVHVQITPWIREGVLGRHRLESAKCAARGPGKELARELWGASGQGGRRDEITQKEKERETEVPAEQWGEGPLKALGT